MLRGGAKPGPAPGRVTESPADSGDDERKGPALLAPTPSPFRTIREGHRGVALGSRDRRGVPGHLRARGLRTARPVLATSHRGATITGRGG